MRGFSRTENACRDIREYVGLAESALAVQNFLLAAEYLQSAAATAASADRERLRNRLSI